MRFRSGGKAVRIRAVTAVAVMAAAAGLGGGTAASAAVTPELVIQAPETYYIPEAGQNPGDGERFPLDLNLKAVEGEDPIAEDVKLTVDASALKGKAVLKIARGDCTREDLVFTCDFTSIDGLTSIRPFAIRGAEGAEPGDGGTITYSVTSSNAKGAEGKTKALVGGPELATRKHGAQKDLKPGSTIELTPGVANHGPLAADKGVGIKLYGQDGAKIAREYSNCHYKSWADTSAYCTFDTPVEPGEAYEVSSPFSYGISEKLMYGNIGYSTWPIGSGNPWEHERPSDYDKTGEGAELTLKPVADSGFEQFAGHVDLTTTQHADYRAITDTVEGAVGDTVRLTLGAENAGPGSMDLSGREGHGSGTYEVTPPEGTTVTSIPFPGEDDDWACSPSEKGAKKYVCTIDELFEPGEKDSLVFNVRIDKKVEDAEGRIDVLDREDYPARDTVADNDSAAIPVKITGAGGSSEGSDSGGSSASGGSGSEGSSGSGDSAGTSGGSADSDGSMAVTGAAGVLPMLAAAAGVLAAGVLAVVFTRRRSRS